MSKTLSHIINEIIHKQSTDEGTVANLHGSVVQSPISQRISREGEWVVYSLPYITTFSPDQIVSRLSSAALFSPNIINTILGEIQFTAPNPGTYLYATLVETPQQVTFFIEITALGQNIAVYTDETLVKKSANFLRVRITVNAGLIPLNIVVTGEGGQTKIVMPDDIRTIISTYIPPVPQWRTDVPIDTDYVDPATGNTGNGLFWRNQNNVGGWGVYKVNLRNFGQIQEAFFLNNKYIFKTDSSILPVPPAIMMVNSGVIGTLDQVIRTEDPDFDHLVLTIRPDQADDVLEDLLNVVSGSVLQAVNFQHLIDIFKSSGEEEISYVDTNVKVGNSFSYVLDAFAPFDVSLRSDKSETKSVIAGDVFPPGAIIIDSGYPKVINGLVIVKYLPPSDEDYKGVNVVYSGVNIITDLGKPGIEDSLTFEPEPASPSYDFLTFDHAGNTQELASGVNWVRDPLLDSFVIPNRPPQLTITQLTEVEQTSAGISAQFQDTLNFAVVKIAALDPEDGTTNVNLKYRLRDGAEQTVLATAPADPNVDDVDDPSGTRTRLIAVTRTERENWIQIWAVDNSGLLSDTFFFTPDYDTIPEISSVDFRLDNDNDRYVISGLVDDDTKSLSFSGTETTSGAFVASGAVGGLVSVKTFSFNMDVNDGTQVVLTMLPYAGDGLTSFSGVAFLKELNRTPRTTVNFEERDSLGQISRIKVRANFDVTPDITKVVDPDGSGTADAGGSATTLIDAAQSGNWTTDEFASTGLAVFYVRITTDPVTAATGQVRKIIDNTTTVLTVATAWSNIPALNDTYEIHKGATLFRKGTTGNFIGTFQPVEISRDSSQPLSERTLQFFSVLHGVPPEAIQTVVVDEDDEASLVDFDASEILGNEIFASITGGDDDAKRWQVFARKGEGTWPTHNTNHIDSGGIPDFNYMRWDDEIAITSFSFAVNDSNFWNVIAVPLDAYNNRGTPESLTVVVDGTGSAQGTLSNLAVSANDDTSDDFNKISWSHNNAIDTTYDTGTATGGSTSTVEDSTAPWTVNEVQTFFVEMTSGAANGDVREITSNTTTELTVSPNFSAAVASPDTYEIYKHEVKIFAYRQDRGIGTQIEITTADREVRLDVDADFDNTNDKNTVVSGGSFLHDIAENRGTSVTGVSRVWKYSLELHDNEGPTVLNKYNINHTDFWIELVPTITSNSRGVNSAGSCPATNEDDLIIRISWVTDNPDDTNYQIDIDVANDVGGTDWNVLTTGQSTNGGLFDDHYPLLAQTGSETAWFRYRFHVVRKSDLVKIETDVGTQLVLTDIEFCEE